MRKILFTLVLAISSVLSYGQGAVFNWAQNYTTPIDKIELDSLSNIYSIGGGSITKRTSSGSLLWTRTITQIQAMAVAPNGDVYIAGGFSGSVNFNSWGAGYLMTSAGNTDIYVSKLNTNGDFVWAQRIGDVGADSATQISLDTLGHIYLTGKFIGNVDFDPGPSTVILGNGTDFILKLDTAGNYIWGQRLDLAGTSGILVSDVDAYGRITCLSYLNGTFDVDPGVGVYSVTTFAEYVLLQLDANGNFNWSFKIVNLSPFYLGVTTLKVDLVGNIYITGNVKGSYDFGGWSPNTPFTSGNQFIVKYNSSGNLVLGKQITSISGASGHLWPGAIDVDKLGNIYLSGGFNNNIYFDGLKYGSSGLGWDNSCYICKLSPNSQFEWVRVFGWFLNPTGINFYVGTNSLAVAPNGCLYNSGYSDPLAQLNLNFVNSTTPPFYISPWLTGQYYIQQICQSSCPTITTSDIDTADCYKVINGQVVASSGTYSINYVTQVGCDSIVNTNLTILDPAVDTIAAIVCDSLIFNNQVLTQSGIYSFITYNPPAGCMSGTVINLTVGSTPDTLTMLACDSFTYAGVTYYSSGQYNQFINNPNGCDTNLTLNLTINHSQFDTTYATSCINYNFNGITYNTSGVFYQYYVAANQCDSVKVLYLDILQPSSSSIVQTTCDSFSLNGITYTNSGLYTQTFTNAVGCDSTLYLYLTITSAIMINIVDTVCQSYTYNGVNYTASGIYYDTIQVANGCDTLVTLDLTIYQNPLLSVFPFTDTTVCIGTSYMLYADSNFVSNQWTLNGNIVSYNDSLLINSSGTYILTCADTNGCYASDTVNIIMSPSPQPIITQNGFVLTCTNVDSVNYQWFWNNNAIGTNDSTFTLNQNGTYVVFTTDSSGCIGVDTLIVTGVGVDTYTLNNQIQFYPNPTTSHLTIQSAIPFADARLRVYDMTGALLQELANLNGSKFQLNLSSYANGLYQIEIINQGVQYRSKVRKE